MLKTESRRKWPKKKTRSIDWSANTYKKTSYPLKRMMNFWRGQSMHEDKGGSFNLDLYLDYLENI